jgi:small-conductance mechanosensitive channel
MDILKALLGKLEAVGPVALGLVAGLLVILLARFIINKRYQGSPARPFRRQIITLSLSLIGLLVVIVLLPVSDTLQGQLLGLIGILLSAAIALSSTTFVGNVMAGMMLRAVRSFRPGDFIEVGDHFGRVSEQGLLHIEIQTEESDLTTMPNLYLVTNPVKVIRSSGTIIYGDVSLGYDIPHTRVEHLLLEAAADAELSDPFVQIRELGNFSVSYRVSGMLSAVKHLITARSRLRERMLDRLHQGGIEVVSPTFMNTRALADAKRLIPEPASRVQAAPAATEKPALEDIVFDKAEEAASLEKLRELHELAGKEMERIKGIAGTPEGEDKESLKQELERLRRRRQRLLDIIKKREEEKKQ